MIFGKLPSGALPWESYVSWVPGLTHGDILAHAARFQDETWSIGEGPIGPGDVEAILDRWRARRTFRFLGHMLSIGVYLG